MVSTFEQAIRLMPQQGQQGEQQSQQGEQQSQQGEQQRGEQQQQGEQQQGEQQQGEQPPPPQPQRPVESWCWVMDFHGFSLRDCDPRLARIFLNLSAAHYPERLGTFFIVSAPAVFNTLWRAISAFIDPVTKQKVGRGVASAVCSGACVGGLMWACCAGCSEACGRLWPA